MAVQYTPPMSGIWGVLDPGVVLCRSNDALIVKMEKVVAINLHLTTMTIFGWDSCQPAHVRRETGRAYLHTLKSTKISLVHREEGGFFAIKVKFGNACRTIAVLFDEDLGFFFAATGLLV
jgi:hypothetical protein